MKTEEQSVRVVKNKENVYEICVSGNILCNEQYFCIIDAIAILGLNTVKNIIVETPIMMRYIKECIPSNYYRCLVLKIDNGGEELYIHAC